MNVHQTRGVAFDIDGVVADVMVPIRENCQEILGRPYNFDLETQYDLTGALGLEDNPENVSEYVDYCLGLIEEIPIDPYTVRLTNALYDYTKRAIPFVTHRHRDPMMGVTYDLLDTFMEVPYTVAFAGGTTYQTHHKAHYIPTGYHFVEDRRATAIELSKRGIFCWLIRTPYNNLDRTQQNSNIVLANDLGDLLDFYF